MKKPHGGMPLKRQFHACTMPQPLKEVNADIVWLGGAIVGLLKRVVA